uniref:Pollen Ole e 1 allergen and extensin family protein n=1 Tax=Populus trichocarpa TaxID=3694 RepID=A9P9E0_POPTR|nr:unknown [Populus trichocarpa]
MARVFMLLALCVLPALVSAARPGRNTFSVQGLVYCDTCLAGFETPKTTYIAGSKVKVECRDRKTQDLVYSKEGTTDSTGKYIITVDEDHKDQICDAMLVSSPRKDCSSPSAGRDRARVILTSYNGLVSTTRYANSMGFMAAQPMSGCTELLRSYQEFDN